MKKSELAMLLLFARGLDSRVPADEAQVAAWALVLDEDIPFEWARDRVREHYRGDGSALMPVHVQGVWSARKATVRAQEETSRMLEARRVGGWQEPSEEVREALAALRRRFGRDSRAG